MERKPSEELKGSTKKEEEERKGNEKPAGKKDEKEKERKDSKDEGEKKEEDEEEDEDSKPRRLSNKEIFRILCFEYKQNSVNGLRIDIISNIVANLYYPFDEGPSKQSFKNQIENLLKEPSFNGEIKEDAFCDLMDKVEKYVNDDSIKQFAVKIFKRFDKDKDNVLSKIEFEHLMHSYRDQSLTQNEIEEIFNDIMKYSNNKAGIDFEAFHLYSYGKLK